MEINIPRYVAPFYSFPSSQVIWEFHASIRGQLIEQWRYLTDDEVEPWASLIGGRIRTVYEDRRWSRPGRSLFSFLDWALEQFIARTMA